jgi:hypothetical protein
VRAIWSKSIIIHNLFNQSRPGRRPTDILETGSEPLALFHRDHNPPGMQPLRIVVRGMTVSVESVFRTN